MKQLIILVLGFSILTGCSYRPREKRLTQFKNNESRILKAFFKISKDTIEFRRILSDDPQLVMQTGQIFFGKYALTYQRFKNVEEFKNEKSILDSLEASISNQGFATKR